MIELQILFTINSIILKLYTIDLALKLYDAEYIHKFLIATMFIDFGCFLLCNGIYSKVIWIVILYMDYLKIKNNIDENSL